MSAPWRALRHRHGVGPLQVVLPMLTWLAVPAVQHVLIPWAGVADLGAEHYVFSAMVVVLLIPVSLLTAQLQEPFHELAAATPRPAVHERIWVLGGCLAQATVGLAAVALLLPATGVRSLVVGDGLLALATAIGGLVLLGTRRAWLFPAVLLGTSSVRSIATWPVISLYRQSDAPLLTVIAAVLLAAAAGAYLTRGPAGG